MTPASQQINDCLARSLQVWLPQGNYLITSRINVTRDNAELRSWPGQTATLVAASNLESDIVFAGQGANYYSVHDLHIDGGLGAGRTCTMNQGANLRADGIGFSIYYVESIHSPCANFQIGGHYFRIHGNYLWHSGTPSPQGGPVGDGLGVFPGSGGEVDYNTIADATDISLLSFGGSRWFHHNHVVSVNYYGLAGFNVGSENGGNHSGAVYENNLVEAEENMLAIGILLGAHPWETDPAYDVSNAGTVRYNRSTGAVINMVVDGIASIEYMHDNTYANARGTAGIGSGCYGYDYVAWHFSQPIQGGWYGMQYDQGIHGFPCVPQGVWGPSVVIASPPSISYYSPGSNITVTSSASDPDGSVVRVDYYANGSFVGSAYSAPWALTAYGVPAGTYVVQAVAVDNGGIPARSAPHTVVVQ